MRAVALKMQGASLNQSSGRKKITKPLSAWKILFYLKAELS